MRPVEWLLTQAHVDARWCIVHATHMTERETAALAASGAVAGLAPTTEADLGDGTFPGLAFLAANGRFGVGSDSNTVISPFAELRQLEYSQRIRARRRNVLPTIGGATVGTSLWARAARGGAQALAQKTGAIAVGQRADLVVLDTMDPALAEQTYENILDAAIFGPSRMPVRDVMARGRFIVQAGRHAQEDAVFARYRATLARLVMPPRFDLLLLDAHLATMRPTGRRMALRDGAVGIRGTIAWVGRRATTSRCRRIHLVECGGAGRRRTGRLPYASRLRGQSRTFEPAPARRPTPTSTEAVASPHGRATRDASEPSSRPAARWRRPKA
jgi:hypothetical protein